MSLYKGLLYIFFSWNCFNDLTPVFLNQAQSAANLNKYIDAFPNSPFSCDVVIFQN